MFLTLFAVAVVVVRVKALVAHGTPQALSGMLGSRDAGSQRRDLNSVPCLNPEGADQVRICSFRGAPPPGQSSSVAAAVWRGCWCADCCCRHPSIFQASGIAEVVKYGLIKDSEFFRWQEGCMEDMAARDAGVLAEAVERSCINKANVRRRILFVLFSV